MICPSENSIIANFPLKKGGYRSSRKMRVLAKWKRLKDSLASCTVIISKVDINEWIE
jgi:hypothetical protein